MIRFLLLWLQDLCGAGLGRKGDTRSQNALSDKIINYKAKTQLWLISENGFLLKGFYLVHRIGGNFCYKLNNILWISLRLEPPL